MTLSKKIYRKIRYPLNDLVCSAGVAKQLLRNRTGKRLLVYHGVDTTGSLEFNTRFISADLFERQIIYFKKNFNVISLKEYYETDISADKLTIALTFDDGYANNFTKVLPILEKYQVPATFFITAIREKGYPYLWTDFYDLLRHKAQTLIFNGETYHRNFKRVFYSQNSGEFLHLKLRKLPFTEIETFLQEMTMQVDLRIEDFHADYHLQMTEEQIAILAKSPYATIGSHTHTHIDLVQRPINEVIDELKFSKTWLEQITNKEIDSIAFPYGLYTTDVVNAAKALGYRKQLAGDLNAESDAKIPELRKRFGINPYLSINNQIWCLLHERYL